MLYSVVLHNNESLESQSLGYYSQEECFELAERIRRVINPGHTVEIITELDDCLEE